MEKNYHFIKQRLENLKAIKPMLMSLRTISLSSWRLALKRLENLKTYRRELAGIANQIGALPDPQQPAPQAEPCLLVLGSTRGLCGGFNRDLAAYFEEHAAEIGRPAVALLFGEKITKLLGRQIDADFRQLEYPRINQLSFSYVSDLVTQYSGEGRPCQVLYNVYHGSGRYKTTLKTIRWQHSAASQSAPSDYGPIIDTDPRELSDYLLRQNNLMELYEMFLSSLAAEHSFRFQIMENAISNTDDLIQELGLMVQVERQKKITSEMRELSISAGLLDR
ncbi:MAG: F-type H+-transporting ATPase subunit gamma [Chloroflexota bacterium]|nr:F-type H+-transporting ATPase subunit gamma [Chloroflexota bacterium]